jgi:predicted nucleotidyltransferase
VRRADAIGRLERLLPELRERFGVRSLTLFGSTARDEAGEDSDVDVVVDLGPQPAFRKVVAVVDALEAELGAHVDVLTPGAVRPRLQRHIVSDGVRIA